MALLILYNPEVNQYGDLNSRVDEAVEKANSTTFWHGVIFSRESMLRYFLEKYAASVKYELAIKVDEYNFQVIDLKKYLEDGSYIVPDNSTYKESDDE